MEAPETKLKTKLVQLQMTVSRTEKVLKTESLQATERQQTSLKTITTEIDLLKSEVEAKKITDEENPDEIETWIGEIDKELSKADVEVQRLQQWQDTVLRDEKQRQREEQLQHERELYETKIKMKSALKLSSESGGGKDEIQAKLPKLTITKFNGTFTDWTRFWNQFSETIDKTDIPNVTKFAYLRELLETNVRKTVEALPFTSEGYTRAKNILEEKYGKKCEIIKAYTKQILELPVIPNVSIKEIHEFYDTLMYAVQSLETMGGLQQVNGNVALTLEKLPGIRGDLTRTDPDWESWDFIKLVEALHRWTRRNPIEQSNERSRGRDRRRIYHVRDQEKQRGCVYCEDKNHKSNECTKVKTVSERRQILAKHRLCFNCTGENHRAAECPSKRSCQNCDRRHHTSICERTVKHEENSGGDENGKKVYTANESNEGVFPVVNVRVNGVLCRALIDSGAGSSYASAKLIHELHLKPVDVQTKKIDMLMYSKQARLETYEVKIESTTNEFTMTTNLIKVDKPELLFLENPNYESLIQNYPHLKGVTIKDRDKRTKLPVHVVLGNGDYSRIKTETRPRVGKDMEPVAELTRLGWFIMSPGKEFDRKKMLLTQTNQSDYEQLCRLDVLGLEDAPEHDQRVVYNEFKEQLTRNPEGWYETELPWRGNFPTLPTNERGSRRRLESLVTKLKRESLTSEYDAIIQDQKRSGIVESAESPAKGVEFYLPHKLVVREMAKTTKVRIVYDASAKETRDSPSLNDCLYPGPPLQNKLWDVLVHQRGYPIVISGDIQKAFLQVRVRENERDALRFHWRCEKDSQLETLRFTRVLFGLAPSPFLLAGVIEQHLSLWEERYPDIVAELRKSLYVDDLLTGGQTIAQAADRKEKAIEVFEDAKFTLHKWNSNASELESNGEAAVGNDEETYAKQQLGGDLTQTTMLGLKWNKSKDTLTVTFPTVDSNTTTTKRTILSKLAKVYDPLGLVSPIILEGKLIFRDVCKTKVPWDADIREPLRRRWNEWEKSLPKEVTVPRLIVNYREPVLSVELHTFGDASTKGVGAVVYSVVRQRSGTTQQLVAAKSRLAKEGLTIPRLELISAHMATNLVKNVQNALENLPEPTIYGWLDSTVALHWIHGEGQYRQFVANRVSKIKQHPEIGWRHVPTKDNPADIASRGGSLSETPLWWSGPEWLDDPKEWPDNLVTEPTATTEAEAKVVREVLCNAQVQRATDDLDQLLGKHDLHRTLRVFAWILRFINNCKTEQKQRGALTTQEIENARLWWIKRVQQDTDMEKDREQLNLQENLQGLIVCHGRIQGHDPIYLPNNHLFTEKLVQEAHLRTLHGGVGLTMTHIRKRYWIPKLRSLAKRQIKSCYGCRRFQATAIVNPPPGMLPKDRTEGNHAFQVVGVDYAGPLKYRKKSGREGKAYIVLYTCSLTRALYLELTATMETREFLPTLKRLIARRGRPEKIYSDNGRTFVGAARCIRTVMADEKIQDFLANQEIKWQFDLSRAPWWGGQFERMVGLVKNCLFKSIGNGCLTWEELTDVLLDIEIILNNRPLSYIEDDLQHPILTPNSLMFVLSNVLPEMQSHRVEDGDLRKRAKFLKRCKDAVWKRWKNEYVRGLRERHIMLKGKPFVLSVGDVVIIKSDERNRGEWPLGIVETLYEGKDGVVRAVRLRAGKSFMERPVQHLYPLELSCDIGNCQETKTTAETELNPEATEFRPRRDAAVAARIRNQLIAETEQQVY